MEGECLVQHPHRTNNGGSSVCECTLQRKKKVSWICWCWQVMTGKWMNLELQMIVHLTFLEWFPKVILQTLFAFIILFNILEHLTIHLLDIFQVVWQEYVQKWWSFSHSVVEMGFSHMAEFESHLPNVVTLSSKPWPQGTFRLVAQWLWSHGPMKHLGSSLESSVSLLEVIWDHNSE